MRDDLLFETRLATALGRYAELAPEMDDLEVAERAIAAGRPSGLLGRLAGLRRGLASTFAGPSGARVAYLLALLALLLAAMLVALAAGVFRTDFVRPLGGNGVIVFTAGGNNHEKAVTRLMNPDGTGDRPIDLDRCPMYSANGTTLATLSYQGSTFLSVTDASGNGSHQILLVEEPGSQVGYALSPDGTQVAWVKPVDSNPRASFDPTDLPSPTRSDDELWVAPTSTGAGHRIVPPSNVKSETLDTPTWSPDGRQIAFGRYRFDEAIGTSRRLSIDAVDVDGSNLHTVTTRPGFLGDTVSWSPDGRDLAYVGVPDGAPDATLPTGSEAVGQTPRDLFVIAADGSAERRITDAPGFEIQPGWSPDGGFLAFVTLDEGQAADRLVTIALDGGVPAGPPTIGPESMWFVWSPDGRELLWQELTPLGAEAFRSTVHAVDPEFKRPSRTVKVIDGLIVCTPSWQRLEP
jgi:dipeptidyl aminopeptidase/acylaminoacyl peptidase